MDHAHEDQRAYHLEQFCAIGACGALSVVAILMYVRGWLGILADPFHLPVLLGGMALLVVVAARAIALCQAVGPKSGHAHHGQDHGHGNGHIHGHAHDYEHTVVPVRYIVLVLPVVLFLLGLPNPAFVQAFHDHLTQIEIRGLGPTDHAAGLLDLPGRSVVGMRIDRSDKEDALQVLQIGKDGAAEKAGVKVGDVIAQITRSVDGDGNPLPKPEIISAKDLSLEEAVAKLEGNANTKVRVTLQRNGAAHEIEITREVELLGLQFKELERAAYTKEQRQFYDGKTGRIVGRFVPGRNARSFSLMRLKYTCCGADAIPLYVVAVLDPRAKEDLSSIKTRQWVEVTGQIQFRRRADRRDEYVSVLLVPSLQAIREVDPDPNPFIQ